MTVDRPQVQRQKDVSLSIGISRRKLEWLPQQKIESIALLSGHGTSVQAPILLVRRPAKRWHSPPRFASISGSGLTAYSSTTMTRWKLTWTSKPPSGLP